MADYAEIVAKLLTKFPSCFEYDSHLYTTDRWYKVAIYRLTHTGRKEVGMMDIDFNDSSVSLTPDTYYTQMMHDVEFNLADPDFFSKLTATFETLLGQLPRHWLR